MTEWGVVGVLISLVGLAAAIVTPITKLTQSITKLTVVVDRLDAEQKNQRADAKVSHQKLWDKCGELGRIIGDHGHRLTVLEQRHKMEQEGEE